MLAVRFVGRQGARTHAWQAPLRAETTHLQHEKAFTPEAAVLGLRANKNILAGGIN
jgi:hypothetical protein